MFELILVGIVVVMLTITIVIGIWLEDYLHISKKRREKKVKREMKHGRIDRKRE